MTDNTCMIEWLWQDEIVMNIKVWLLYMIVLWTLKVLIDLYVEWYGNFIWHYESVAWNMNDEVAMIMETNMKHVEKWDWHMHRIKWILKWSVIHEWCPRDNMKMNDTVYVLHDG